MIIGGYQPSSFCDYPGRVASVIFTQGCNFRCPYCHNRSLLPMTPSENSVEVDRIVERLRERRNRVGSVVVTGGEPTVHEDLPAFLARLRGIGLAIKLDTNGANPAMLRTVIEAGLVDFVAMDIKAPFDKYGDLAGHKVSLDHIKTSIDIIAQSGIEHEFRTTVVPSLLDEEDVAMIRMSLPHGSPHRSQAYRPVPKPERLLAAAAVCAIG